MHEIIFVLFIILVFLSIKEEEIYFIILLFYL